MTDKPINWKANHDHQVGVKRRLHAMYSELFGGMEEAVSLLDECMDKGYAPGSDWIVRARRLVEVHKQRKKKTVKLPTEQKGRSPHHLPWTWEYRPGRGCVVVEDCRGKEVCSTYKEKRAKFIVELANRHAAQNSIELRELMQDAFAIIESEQDAELAIHHTPKDEG